MLKKRYFMIFHDLSQLLVDNGDGLAKHTVDFGEKIKVHIDNQYLVVQTTEEESQRVTLFPVYIVRQLDVM